MGGSAGWQVRERETEEVLERRRVMAVCWGPGDPATTLAMLDDNGQLADILFAGQLSGLIRRPRQDEDPFQDPAKVRRGWPGVLLVCLGGT